MDAGSKASSGTVRPRFPPAPGIESLPLSPLHCNCECTAPDMSVGHSTLSVLLLWGWRRRQLAAILLPGVLPLLEKDGQEGSMLGTPLITQCSPTNWGSPYPGGVVSRAGCVGVMSDHLPAVLLAGGLIEGEGGCVLWFPLISPLQS